MIWKIKVGSGIEYFVIATPEEIETATRQFGMTGWCDCSLVEQVVERSHSYSVCAICGKKFDARL